MLYCSKLQSICIFVQGRLYTLRMQIARGICKKFAFLFLGERKCPLSQGRRPCQLPLRERWQRVSADGEGYSFQIRSRPGSHHPWQCSPGRCSLRSCCLPCVDPCPAPCSRRSQWHRLPQPCQRSSAASWRQRGCRRWG